MKKYIYTFIIIVIIIVGVGYYAWSRSATSPSMPTTSTTTPSGGVATSTLKYTNSQYGFTFTLPQDWQGYTIVTSTWSDASSGVHGPEILIRNPHWTATSMWQDIPIMVFTTEQWKEVSQGTLVVSAAPIPPSLLGQNSKYVFALPARYNYAYPQGWQEVQTIMQGNPLQGFN